MKPLNMHSKIWKSFCNQDCLLSSSTWSGRLFFCTKIFAFSTATSRASWYQLTIFWIWFYKSYFKNTCRASPKPDVQHKNALISHLNDRWISKFLEEKFVLWKSSLIHLILHKTGTITSGFEGKKRKYHLLKIWVLLWYALSRAVHKNRTSQVRFSPSKPDLIRPKNACMIVICFLQAFIEPWKSNDRLHGIPGHDPDKESRKTPPEGGRNTIQRERRKNNDILFHFRKDGLPMTKLSQLKIDPEFQNQINPPSFEETHQLEMNILKEERVLNPIITWNGYIVDGHIKMSF